MQHSLYLLSTWIHIVAATLWVGGTLFLVLVLMPCLRAWPHPDMRSDLIQRVGLRFRSAGWVALLTLFITGAANLYLRGITLSALETQAFWQGAFGQTLALKLLLVAGVLTLSLVHDFSVGPRAAATNDPRLRRMASWLGRVTLLIGLLIMLLGVMLVRGRPW